MNLKLHEFVFNEMELRKINMAALSRMAGIDSGGLSRFVNGRQKNPSTKFVRKIFVALDIDMEILKDLEI